MSRISLRWRITILMGVLLLSAAILLTVLSIQNMDDNFTLPVSSIGMENSDVDTDENSIFSLDPDGSQLPDNVYYVPELLTVIENARQSFSAASLLYMILVAAIGMFAAYHLAGRAMRPISKLNAEIETIDVNNLSKRIAVPATKDEIENLSHSFNQLLARLEQDFEKEKRFSANVAHELKTPLATIMTSAQVLAMDDSAPLEEYREHLDITLESIRRLCGVVDRLLLLNGSALDAPFEAVDLSQILFGIQTELNPLYCAKNITLTYDLQEIMLTGNPELLYRAFFNLLENAYKYNKDNGSITITSSSCQNHIVICISNSGPGIPEDDIAHIFEPFYRADKSRSRKIAGAGLGLSITKDIFNLHQADISIRSKPGLETVAEVRFGR